MQFVLCVAHEICTDVVRGGRVGVGVVKDLHFFPGLFVNAQKPRGVTVAALIKPKTERRTKHLKAR